MRLVLTLAFKRASHRAYERLPAVCMEDEIDQSGLVQLWDLAERYHPELAWLAESWLRGERTLGELERVAPRGCLAPGFLQSAQGRVGPADCTRFPTRPNDSAAMLSTGG